MRRVISAFHALISASIVRAKEAAASARAYMPPGSVLCVGIPYFGLGLFLGCAPEKKRRKDQLDFFPQRRTMGLFRNCPPFFLIPPTYIRQRTGQTKYIRGKGKRHRKKKSLRIFTFLFSLQWSYRARQKKRQASKWHCICASLFLFFFVSKQRKKKEKMTGKKWMGGYVVVNRRLTQ
nr:hypothetical protein [Pandoravirus aubagnensis]